MCYEKPVESEVKIDDVVLGRRTQPGKQVVFQNKSYLSQGKDEERVLWKIRGRGKGV